MPKRIQYRQYLLRAIAAFLERTSASQSRALRIIEKGILALYEDEQVTLNTLIWRSYFTELSDSVYYEDEAHLHELHELFYGNTPHALQSWIIRDDFQKRFTEDEREWYGLLLSLIAFLEQIPYEQISQATHFLWQQQDRERLKLLPEFVQAQVFERQLQQRTESIKMLSTRVPHAECMGKETLHYLLLQDVTSWMSGLRVDWPVGHPLLFGPGTTSYQTGDSAYNNYHVNGINGFAKIAWAKRMLEALAGKEDLYLSLRFGKGLSHNEFLLFVLFH